MCGMIWLFTHSLPRGVTDFIIGHLNFDDNWSTHLASFDNQVLLKNSSPRGLGISN
jgi:hypothetical protein